jgi:hypothetical protein
VWVVGLLVKYLLLDPGCHHRDLLVGWLWLIDWRHQVGLKVLENPVPKVLVGHALVMIQVVVKGDLSLRAAIAVTIMTVFDQDGLDIATESLLVALNIQKEQGNPGA